MGGTEFESLTYQMMVKASDGTFFKNNITRTGPQTFPDIVAKNYFGVEVKATADDKWLSTGNSVLETTRVESVERIYMFFGKFGGEIDIKFRLYQECLNEVGVTHSPRYKINMDLPKGHSIFDKIGINYDILRKGDNAIQRIKQYYRGMLQEGEELWWIDPQEVTTSPIIRSFSKFTYEEKFRFMTEAMILFPEVFGKSSVKFERLASYLITGYNAVSSNLRDSFTAGGRIGINIAGKRVVVPKIYQHLLEHAKDIEKTIKSMPVTKLSYHWRLGKIKSNRLSQWLEMVDKQAVKDNIQASKIFKSGL